MFLVRFSQVCSSISVFFPAPCCSIKVKPADKLKLCNCFLVYFLYNCFPRIVVLSDIQTLYLFLTANWCVLCFRFLFPKFGLGPLLEVINTNYCIHYLHFFNTKSISCHFKYSTLLLIAIYHDTFQNKMTTSDIFFGGLSLYQICHSYHCVILLLLIYPAACKSEWNRKFRTWQDHFNYFLFAISIAILLVRSQLQVVLLNRNSFLFYMLQVVQSPTQLFPSASVTTIVLYFKVG